MNTKYTPSHIANYFLIRAKKENVKITPMKLIKMVYFAYAWSLALLHRKLFDENIEKWPYGPVISSLYHEFKRFRKSNITELSIDNDTFSPVLIDDDDDDVRGIVSAIWDMYSEKSATELSDITHRIDSAWHKTDMFTCMSDDDIITSARDGIDKYVEKFGIDNE